MRNADIDDLDFIIHKQQSSRILVKDLLIKPPALQELSVVQPFETGFSANIRNLSHLLSFLKQIKFELFSSTKKTEFY